MLFFLNPHLPFETVHVLRGARFYGALLGTTGLPVLLLWCRGQQRLSQRLLPSWLTLVLLVGAGCFWVHAYAYGEYLPPGIHRRLIKAALSLTVAALVCFYTIVLHRLRRRPYGVRSRLLFASLALLSVYAVMERREAFRPGPEPSPRPTTVASAGRPQLAVVAIETATLEAVLPLAEQGRLPFFASCMEGGALGRLEALRPVRPTALWTTVATGLLPFRHGVVSEQVYEGFLGGGPGQTLRLLPVGLAFDRWGTLGEGRTVDRRQMSGLPMWEVLTRLGLATAVIGWPATAPVSSDVGFVVTDGFFRNHSETEQVAPRQLAQRARLFETLPAELGADIVARFGPDTDREVLRQLSGDVWRRELALYLLAQESIDALFVHLPGLGDISRDHYGGFEAVHFRGSTDPESAASARWTAAYYSELDSFLARLWETMETPRQLVVMSAHGVRGLEGWDDLLRVISRQPARRGNWHDGPDGLFVLRGEGFRAGGALGRARLVDPMPTLLYGLGLPVARDLDGTVLTEAFDPSFLARQPLSFVPSYETFAPVRPWPPADG